MVICTRFRELPDEQMKFVDAYLEAGKPVIGIRAGGGLIPQQAGDAVLQIQLGQPGGDYAGGFGQQVLGSTWISHHGAHGKESTRGVIVEAQRSHPILRGVETMWGPSDVYTIRTPIPHDGQVLVMGQVLKGMKPDDPPSEKPQMPLAWTKHYPTAKGSAPRLHDHDGHEPGLREQGFRRMVINACFWAVGLEEKITATTKVGFVGQFAPTPFGFNTFRRGLKPDDLAAQAAREMSDFLRTTKPLIPEPIILTRLHRIP